MNFKIWLEDQDSRRAGIRDTILNFLKNKLNIKDENTILDMNTNEIDDSVVAELSNRGLISTSNADILSQIKDGITIGDLIDKLTSDGAGGMPSPGNNPSPLSDPRLQAQQAIRFQ